MRLKLKKAKYIIKTQNLVKSSADGCIAARDEITYNKMNEAMFKLKTSLFIQSINLITPKKDLTILDDGRTIAPVGLFYPQHAKPRIKPNDINEIDLSKALTKAFMDISKIIVFNQFGCMEVLRRYIQY